MTFASMVSVLPHVRSGELRVLGVTGAKRSATTPDVPTIAEASVSGYNTVTWYGVLAPASTPRAIVETLNADMNQVLKSRELLGRMALEGAEAMGGTPERFAAYLDSEIRKWARIIRDAGVN
jgi:tripartite-type tricarboxylate transporter receptor subunit TctC